MCILIIIAANRWREMGNSQLRANWNEGLLKGGTSPRAIIRQIYYGFCLGMLGLTGFECDVYSTFHLFFWLILLPRCAFICVTH